VNEFKEGERGGIKDSSGTAGPIAGGKVVEPDHANNVPGMIHQVGLQPEDYENVIDWKTVVSRYRC